MCSRACRGSWCEIDVDTFTTFHKLLIRLPLGVRLLCCVGTLAWQCYLEQIKYRPRERNSGHGIPCGKRATVGIGGEIVQWHGVSLYGRA